MNFQIDFLESHDHASIADELRRIAALLGKRTITAKEIDKYGRLNSRTIAQRFGTMRKAHEAAGLIAARYTKSTDEELLKVVADLWTITLREYGRRPRASEVKKFACPVSARTIVGRFGSWKRALIATATSRPSAAPPPQAIEPRKQRQPLSVAKRYFVLKRDRYQCRLCKQSAVELEVDHIVPVCQGGQDTLDNLQALCKTCNRSKGGKLQ